MLRSFKARTAVAILIALGVALIAMRTIFEPVPAQDLIISTSTRGGTYIIIGEQLARIVNEYPTKAIRQATATPSAGSRQNIDRLLSDQADVALVMAPVLASDPRRDGIRALMSLYSDVWQVLVRTSASIASLEDLKGKRVYIGADGSGTKWGATRILQAVNISESDYRRLKVHSYAQAAEKLKSGEADAAFLISATPAKAVSSALSSGCCELLDLRNYKTLLKKEIPGLEDRDIAAHSYENQPDTVETLGTKALLVARSNLGNDVVDEILNAAFDHIDELAVAHIRVQDIRLEQTFTELPDAIELHPAAIQFRDQENKKLRIATGVINGKYYDVGKRMQLVLQKRGISTRVIHTDGSIENLNLLRNNKNILAIAQYDVALASIWSSTVYNKPALSETLGIPTVKGLRRLAALHNESLHVLMRRDRIPPEQADHPTLTALKTARVCLGPKNSGTQIIAKVLLTYHEITPKQEMYLSVPDMVARINSGEIDAGFFVSFVPGEALKTVADDHRNRLLSVDPRKIGRLLGPALRATRIENGTYGAQREGEPPVNTVATRAVLVTREDLPFDLARNITDALLEGEAFLGIEGGATAMAEEIKSLPLHPGARASFEQKGLVPRAWWKLSWTEILGLTWRFLAICVILVGSYQGALKLRRDRTSNEIGRRVFAISLEPNEPDSVHSLLEIRDREIRERVQQRWWRAGELDKSRWRHLHDLINDRIKLAKENLTAALAEDLRGFAHETGLDAADRRQRLQSLEERVWTYFQKGELDASHQAMLMEVIERSLR